MGVHDPAGGPWPRTLLCLAIGAAGGLSFVVLNVPIPWLLGSMLATTAATLSGVRLVVEPRLRASMLMVIGVLIGSAFEPDLWDRIGRWWWSLAALPLYVLVIAGIVMAYLRRVAGFDPVTAYFSAAPGGLSEMVLLSDRAGGDVRKTSLVHALRLVMLVTAIPFVVDQMGLAVPEGMASGPAAGWLETLMLAAVALTGFSAARLLRLPSPVLLGPMLASAAVHVAGWIDSHPPEVWVGIAQVVVGSAVGSRFSGLGFKEVVATLGHGAVMTTLMLVLSAAFAVAIHPFAGVGLLALLIAYVPGGVAEMALVALALGIDPAFVSTHHVVRIMLVVSLASLLVRWVAPPGSTRRSADSGSGD